MRESRAPNSSRRTESSGAARFAHRETARVCRDSPRVRGVIARQIRSPKSRAEAVGSTVTTLTRTLAVAGFRIDRQDKNSVVYIRSLWRTLYDAWLIFLPIALIQGRHRITVSFMDDPGGGTLITIAGTASRRVARQFNRLAEG